MNHSQLGCLSLTLLVLVGGQAVAQQQVGVGTPAIGLNDGFFERNGVGWGLSGNGWFARFGGFGGAIPQFGGFQPDAGAVGGIGFMGGGVRGGIEFEFSQGFRSSAVSQTPGLVLSNGFPGTFIDQSFSPFVIGVVPVVSDLPTLPSVPQAISGPSKVRSFVESGEPLPGLSEDRSKSSRGSAAGQNGPSGTSTAKTTERPLGSLARARRLRATRAAQEQSESDAQARREMSWGDEALREKKLGVAKSFYQSAAKKGSAELRQTALQKLKRLAAQSAP